MMNTIRTNDNDDDDNDDNNDIDKDDDHFNSTQCSVLYRNLKGHQHPCNHLGLDTRDVTNKLAGSRRAVPAADGLAETYQNIQGRSLQRAAPALSFARENTWPIELLCLRSYYTAGEKHSWLIIRFIKNELLTVMNYDLSVLRQYSVFFLRKF